MTKYVKDTDSSGKEYQDRRQECYIVANLKMK